MSIEDSMKEDYGEGAQASSALIENMMPEPPVPTPGRAGAAQLLAVAAPQLSLADTFQQADVPAPAVEVEVEATEAAAGDSDTVTLCELLFFTPQKAPQVTLKAAPLHRCDQSLELTEKLLDRGVWQQHRSGRSTGAQPAQDGRPQHTDRAASGQQHRSGLKPAVLFFCATDQRLQWLEKDFPDYLEALNNACKSSGKKFLSAETYEAILLTSKSTVLCVKFLLESGFFYVLTRNLSSDPVELLFSSLRQMAGGNDCLDARAVTFSLERILRTGNLCPSQPSNVENGQAVLR
ncbi:hypothetical protein HPB48_023415 [Haemaphysalis longicornis]|uniref:Uncharacterized protein n=1 Tax=Haemaphysalis longicornis TaxID=44386 RepID=A0A9J6H821_HAELO|nr:hypothetical protein HPB48_023415 [Haemaphysalis longicornis]